MTTKTEERRLGESIRLYIDLPFPDTAPFPGDRLVQLIESQKGWFDWQIRYGVSPNYEDKTFIIWG